MPPHVYVWRHCVHLCDESLKIYLASLPLSPSHSAAKLIEPQNPKRMISQWQWFSFLLMMMDRVKWWRLTAGLHLDTSLSSKSAVDMAWSSWCAPCAALATHAAFIYVALLLLLLHTYCRPLPRAPANHKLLPNHTPFWLIIFLLLLLHAIALAAQLLLPRQLLHIVSSTLGILATAAGGAMHMMIESGGRDALWLLPLVAYFLVATGTTALSGMEREALFFQVDVGVAGASCVAMLLLFHAVLTNKRRDRGPPRPAVGQVEEDQVYAQDVAPLPSRLTFFWFTRLLRVGYFTPLEDVHLGFIPHQHRTYAQVERFRGSSRPLLWPLLWSVVGWKMGLGGVFRLLADLAGFVAPLGIKTIVSWSGSNRTEWVEPLTATQFLGNGYVMVGVVLVSSLLQATFSQCSTYLVNTEGLHVKVALQGMIYEKSLRVAGRGEETGNLIGEDANNVMMLFWMAHFVWAIPLKLAVLMFLLWTTLGLAALVAGALCILVMIPLQFLIAKAMSNNSKLLLERCDERLGWMSEIVGNMRLLKAHAWEALFGERLGGIRTRELKHLDNDLLYRSLMTFLTQMSTVVVTVVTFGLYPLLEESRLEAAAVFAGLALFNQLTVPLFIFPITVPVLIDAFVSGKRILDFLSLPEIHHDSCPFKEEEEEEEEEEERLTSTKLRALDASTDSVFVLENIAEDEEEEVLLLKGPQSVKGEGAECLVALKDASLCWDDDQQPVLSGISVEIRKERLTVVVGPTGSGKSSLLSAFLGELKLSQGSLSWARGKRTQIAYASQTPWILNGTVRENIVFGSGFKGRRYKRVLQAVSLTQDLELLPERDATEIGDYGVNLSGGQRQRIAIARALYSTAPLVILDDPLSALDVEVAVHVLDVGIRKLLARRTVLLVTHHLPVLHHAHHIVALEGGRVRIQGSLPDIKVRDPPLAAHWHELISKKEAELARHMEVKTAKERWTLLKLVSKFGYGIRAAKKTEETPPHFRSRKGTFSAYKNLSHDFFLPSDECHDELLTPILSRRPLSRASRGSRASTSSTKHVVLQRMSSLQPPDSGSGHVKNSKFSRLQSEPMDEEVLALSPRKYRSEVNRLHSSSNEPLFKLRHIFTTKKPTVNSVGSLDAEPLPSPPVGSVQSEGELTEDDPQERDGLLGGSGDEREYGSVPIRVYLIYARACGSVLSFSYLIFAIGYEVVRVLTSFWLSQWSDSVSQDEEESVYEEQMSYYFRGYVVLSVVTVGVSLTCNLLGKAAGARSRRLLHHNFVSRLLDAPLSFFESTPIGRILGRASADVAVVDRKLVISVQRFLQFVCLCLSAVVVNGIVSPWFLLLALPLVAIYYIIQRLYRVSSRELQRLQAISRGPILSHFHETLQGLSTIRAYGREKAFIDHMFACIDLNNRADMFINVGNRWLSISLDYLGSVIVAVASLGAVVSADLGLVTPSVVGLAINYTLLVPVYLNWVVKFLAEVEMFMNSVDRLDKYSELEGEQLEGTSTPPPNWPSAGVVEFDKVTISYDDTPIVHSLSLSIPGGQKVGVCGRSGSGKSTLLSSLFRLSGRVEGRIAIDGVNIHHLPLRTLRSALCIIPQHSVLFTAPLRFNLDPGGKATDAELWAALELAQMKEPVQQLTHQLDEIMSPDSFSAGQRQLIALAVAILHKSRVVVMDEATSSVDGDTEQTLLSVVSKEFKNSTVMSIAHRLGTIVEGDRVVVLEEGKIVEDGSPAQLLSRRSKSIFADMLRADAQLPPVTK